MKKKKLSIKREKWKWLHELKRKKKRKILRYRKRLFKQTNIVNEKNIKYKKIIPPKNFSFINNTDEIIDYFKWYSKYARKKEPINFDLFNIDNLTFDSIAILLSYIKDIKYSGTLISWRAPNDIKLKKVFLESDFYSFVNSNLQFPKDFVQWKAINHKSNKKVSPEIAWNIRCQFDDILEIKERNKLYNILIECMQNTKEHAWKWFDWWIFFYNNKEKWTKEICFLDLWIWIFWSLNTKIEFFKDIFWKISWLDYNTDKLKLLFEWKWQNNSSITKESKRWNWLKDIYKFSQTKSIKKFIVITN